VVTPVPNGNADGPAALVRRTFGALFGADTAAFDAHPGLAVLRTALPSLR
jgi:hypothetical protein